METLKAKNLHNFVEIIAIHFIIKVNSIATLMASLFMKLMVFRLIIIIVSIYITITAITSIVNIAYHINLLIAFIIAELTF